MIFLSAGSASSSRTSSQSGCPLHEAPPYEATATRKGEGPGEGKVGQSKTPADSVQSPSFSQTCTHQHQHPTAAWRACRSSVNFSTVLYTRSRTHTHTHTQTVHTHTEMSQRFLSQLASSVLRVFGCSHDPVSVWMEDLYRSATEKSLTLCVCVCVCAREWERLLSISCFSASCNPWFLPLFFYLQLLSFHCNFLFFFCLLQR